MSSRLLSNQTLLEGMATVGFSQPLADKKRAIQEQIEACVFKLVCCDSLPARHIQLSAQRPIEFIYVWCWRPVKRDWRLCDVEPVRVLYLLSLPPQWFQVLWLHTEANKIALWCFLISKTHMIISLIRCNGHYGIKRCLLCGDCYSTKISWNSWVTNTCFGWTSSYHA